MKAWHEYEDFTRQWLTEAARLLKPTASLYVFMGARFISTLFRLLEEDFQLLFNGWITWHYTRPPITSIEFEMDVRGCPNELVIAS